MLMYMEHTRMTLLSWQCHLLDGSDIYEDLKLLLDEEDLAVVMNSQHRPNCLLQLMTQCLSLVDTSDNRKSLMVRREPFSMNACCRLAN